MAPNLFYVIHELHEESEMSDSIMPMAGAVWTADPEALITSGENKGYKKDTCMWNVAWNKLRSQNKGAQNDAASVAALVQTLLAQYDQEVEKGKIKEPSITNANDVTTGQLTALAHVADPTAPTPTASATPPSPLIHPPRGVPGVTAY
jgi:hypothetical protein